MRPRAESLEFALLGLLSQGPLHGYELRKRMTAIYGPFRALSFSVLYSFYSCSIFFVVRLNSILSMVCLELVFENERRCWLVVFAIRVPVDRHLLPEVHPVVVGQTQVHAHRVSDVQVGHVVVGDL